MEEVNSSMTYLIYFKNFCKCHNVPPASATIKREITGKTVTVVHACHPSYMESINRRNEVQVSLGLNARPYSKITKAQRAGGMA
jgi:hypothetical protein